MFVCGESFSNISVSEQLTPTLWRMAHEGIVLTNYYNSFKNTTTNGEFAMLTGLWPDVSRKADVGQTNGSFSQSATHFMPFGLGNLLRHLLVKIGGDGLALIVGEVAAAVGHGNGGAMLRAHAYHIHLDALLLRLAGRPHSVILKVLTIGDDNDRLL